MISEDILHQLRKQIIRFKQIPHINVAQEGEVLNNELDKGSPRRTSIQTLSRFRQSGTAQGFQRVLGLCAGIPAAAWCAGEGCPELGDQSVVYWGIGRLDDEV